MTDEARLNSEIANLRTALQSEIASLQSDLRGEIGTVRAEILNARVERAERHVSRMRDWLGLLTFIITVAFVVFGILGYSRWSDINAARTQVRADTKTYHDEMQTDMTNMTAQKQQVDAAAHQADQAAGGLLARFGIVERKVENIEGRLDKADKVLDAAQQSAQQSRIDTSNALTNFEGLSSSPFTNPLILQMPTWTIVKNLVQSKIGGINFGETRGHLYAYVEWLPPPLSWFTSSTIPASVFQSPSEQVDESQRVEISPSSILDWHDTTITFTFSSDDYNSLYVVRKRLESAANATAQQLGGSSLASVAYLTFRVVDANGQSSGLSATMQWPWQAD